MKTTTVLLAIILHLSPVAVANRCAGEASVAVRECSCTVRNRLEAGWSERRVLSAYYAPDARATDAQIAQVAAVLAGESACNERLYFMYSRADTEKLGIAHYTPALTVRSGETEVRFYERWFRKTK